MQSKRRLEFIHKITVTIWQVSIYIVLTTTLFVIIGCSSKSRNDTQTSSGDNKWYSPAARDSLCELMVGQWINKEYLDELIATRSPLKASDKLRNLGEFTIERLDTNPNELGWKGSDFHCGDGGIIELVRNDSLVFSNMRLATDKKNTLYFPDPDMEYAEESKEFVRLDNFTGYINELILAGTYSDVDAPENKLVFSTEGTVHGLDNFNKIDFAGKKNDMPYEVILDCFLTLFDLLCIGDYCSKSGHSFYIYDNSDHNLEIYSITHNDNDPWDVKGVLLYKLRRVGS